MKLILKIMILLMAYAPMSYAAEPCDDWELAYKICENQQTRYIKGFDAALKSDKVLFLVFGFEACPWCQSLYQIFHLEDFLQNNSLADKFELVEIGTYEAGEERTDGLAVLAQVRALANDDRGHVTYPFFAFINPRTGKTIVTNTIFLNDNHAGAGHNRPVLLQYLQGIPNKLKFR